MWPSASASRRLSLRSSRTLSLSSDDEDPMMQSGTTIHQFKAAGHLKEVKRQRSLDLLPDVDEEEEKAALSVHLGLEARKRRTLPCA